MTTTSSVMASILLPALKASPNRAAYALSDDAYRQVRGKVEIACDDLGPQTLKNIAEPMRAWRVQLGGKSAVKAPSGSPAGQAPPLAPPNKPSIAVLPFQNMSGDPEQEYFADGLTEDIITELAHISSMSVIARNSTFVYKGKAVDVKKVGCDLGARYVLEGSVRRMNQRVRVTAQLIETSTGLSPMGREIRPRSCRHL